jgi:hypothetical protein
VALAAGLCFATIDTDAIGSGRLPAAICGVTCHKPTFGLLSGEGILAGEKADPVILALSHPSVMARLAEDARLALAGLTGETLDDRPITRLGSGSNFSATAELRAAFAEATTAVRRAGGWPPGRVADPFQRASFDTSAIERHRAENRRRALRGGRRPRAPHPGGADPHREGGAGARRQRGSRRTTPSSATTSACPRSRCPVGRTSEACRWASSWWALTAPTGGSCGWRRPTRRPSAGTSGPRPRKLA